MSRRRFDAVLFDLGSTLIYFDADWEHVIPLADSALLNSLRLAGLDLEEQSILVFRSRMERYYKQREKDFIEHTTYSILRSVLFEWGYRDVPEEVLRQALSDLHAITQAHWKPEVNAIQVLQKLKVLGYRLGLISNAADDADVQMLVDKAGVRSYFDVILTSAVEKIRKPDPQIFLRALDILGIPPSRAVMVGDLLGTDILGAQNAGIFNVWITRRANLFANQTYLNRIKPDAEIASLGDLPELITAL